MLIGVVHRDDLHAPATHVARLLRIGRPSDLDAPGSFTIPGDQDSTRAVGLLQLGLASYCTRTIDKALQADLAQIATLLLRKQPAVEGRPLAVGQGM